jgi:UDP-N-acetylglucosamine--N-acetylmuramyl-(pentapeptide) pyrophosphoryl-undecaprenol N-acetylglucosamine transferase
LADRNLEVVHQTGESMRDEVERNYKELGIRARVVTFIDEIARAYANAALVVARAGATTLAELCAIGRASILIPFPFAADDHQAKNAKALEQRGAAICIRESELDVKALGDLIGDLLNDVAKRQAMAKAARDHGRPDAAAAIVDDIMGWLAGVEPLGEAPAGPQDDTSRGAPYIGLTMAPLLRLGCSEVAMRPVPARPRRPVVVDGALWE